MMLSYNQLCRKWIISWSGCWYFGQIPLVSYLSLRERRWRRRGEERRGDGRATGSVSAMQTVNSDFFNVTLEVNFIKEMRCWPGFCLTVPLSIFLMSSRGEQRKLGGEETRWEETRWWDDTRRGGGEGRGGDEKRGDSTRRDETRQDEERRWRGEEGIEMSF